MNNFNIKLLVLLSFLTLFAGCSKVSTEIQNMTGAKIEAYFSPGTNIVCFTETGSESKGIDCQPSELLNTKNLKPNDWTVI